MMLTFAGHSFEGRHTLACVRVDAVHTCTSVPARIAGAFVNIYNNYLNSVNDVISLSLSLCLLGQGHIKQIFDR